MCSLSRPSPNPAWCSNCSWVVQPGGEGGSTWRREGEGRSQSMRGAHSNLKINQLEISSLIPRPHPAIRHFRTASDKKLKGGGGLGN